MLPLLLMGVVALGSGCSETHEGQRPITLKLSTWGSAEEIALVRERVQAFEVTHPTVHVDVLHIPENYFQKLHILVAGGLTPDVMFVNSFSFAEYAENHLLMPLDGRFSPADLPRSTFFEPALKALSWQKNVYAVPRDVSDLVVYVNEDLFQQAHLTVPSSQWHQSEMLAAAQKLTRDTDHDGSLDQFGVSFFAKPPLFWLPFVWSDGGRLFDPSLTRLALADSPAVEALQFYADLRNRWHVAPSPKDVGTATMSQLFLQGKLAMMVSGRWTVPVLREQAKFHWDVLPFPQGKAGSVVGVDASGYAIAKMTPHPEESWALVSFLSSRETQETFSKSGLIVPARIDVAHGKAFLSAPPAHGRVFLDVIAHGEPTCVPVAWNEIAEDLNLALEPVWEGTQTAQEAMNRVKPQIERLLR